MLLHVDSLSRLAENGATNDVSTLKDSSCENEPGEEEFFDALDDFSISSCVSSYDEGCGKHIEEERDDTRTAPSTPTTSNCHQTHVISCKGGTIMDQNTKSQHVFRTNRKSIAVTPSSLQNRSAQWFDDAADDEDALPSNGIAYVQELSVLPGHSPASAFQRPHQMKPRMNNRSTTETYDARSPVPAFALSKQLRLDLQQPSLRMRSSILPENNPADSDDVRQGNSDPDDDSYGFCAVSQSSTIVSREDNNISIGKTATSPDIITYGSAPYSREQDICLISPLSIRDGEEYRDDQGPKGSFAKVFRRPRSPWSAGSASTWTMSNEYRNAQKSRNSNKWKPFKKLSSGRSDKGAVGRSVVISPTKSLTDSSEEDARDPKATVVTITQNDHERQQVRLAPSPLQLHMNENPFIIKEGEEEEIDWLSPYADSARPLVEIDDGGIELIPDIDDYIPPSTSTLSDDVEDTIYWLGPSGLLRQMIDVVNPMTYIQKLSPLLGRLFRRRQVQAPAPLEVLPTNAVTAKCGRTIENKRTEEPTFDPLLLIQSITLAHVSPIWRMEFSSDGKYLATVGEDGLLSIYEVAPKQSQQPSYDDPTSAALAEWEAAQGAPPPTDPTGTGAPLGTEIDILSSKALRRYQEHSADIVDMSWSKTNFLLTASLDKTVRLWHVSRSTSIHCFVHTDCVTSVDFHPNDDKFFVSGSFDKKVRMWDITSVSMTEWAQAPDVVTAVRYLPNRYLPNQTYVVAGLMHGQVLLYTADELKYHTQLAAKNRRGRKKDGAKVTGFAFLRTETEVYRKNKALKAILKSVRGLPMALSPRRRRGRRNARDDDDKSQASRSIISASRSIFSANKSVISVFSANKSVTGENKRRRFRLRVPKRVKRARAQAKKLNLSPKLLQQVLSAARLKDGGDSLLYKDKLLVTTNDSRIRLFGLDDYCMSTKYKGVKNDNLQIKARISESGSYVISGSDRGGMLHIWDTSVRNKPLNVDSTGPGGNRHRREKIRVGESFQATNAIPAIVTDAHFVPKKVLCRALKNSGLFPTLSNLNSLGHDLTSSAIITCDYEGTIRVLLRKQLLDDVIKASGPEGMHG